MKKFFAKIFNFINIVIDVMDEAHALQTKHRNR